MVLDAALGDRRCWWLSPECDKRAFFDPHSADRTATRRLPAHRLRSGTNEHHPLLPGQVAHRHPEGRHESIRVLYLVNRQLPVDFRQFLIRHAELFRFLHEWRVRLLLPRRFRRRGALQGGAARRTLDSGESEREQVLKTYFGERQEQGGHLGDPSDRYIAQEFRNRACRRSKPSIGRGDDQETGFSGSRARRACATTGPMAVRRSKFSC